MTLVFTPNGTWTTCVESILAVVVVRCVLQKHVLAITVLQFVAGHPISDRCDRFSLAESIRQAAALGMLVMDWR